ncbi:5'-methylthioadenosine/S-adenosylhomocysteine nucleosidase, partial [Hyella patelloides]|uniref:5'-methylthioadenosine/S-adenosylhomocysteine nucleosidase family protein n=1 Tax=Hyella patelloides TaxID=1982969 RepID=UPI0011A1C100
MDIRGKRFYFIGSAGKNTLPPLLSYAHELVAELVKTLATRGATFAVQIGKEPLSVESDPTSPSIIFDWTIVTTIYECIQQGIVNIDNYDEPIIFTVYSYKTQRQIPASKQDIWNSLLDLDAVEIEIAESEFGHVRRENLDRRGDILIALSGGAGTESLLKKYKKNEKPAIPLDLHIGSSCNDHKVSASHFAQELLTQPEQFISIPKTKNIGLLLSRLTTRQGEKPVPEVVTGVLELIHEIDEIPSQVDVLVITALKDELDALLECDNDSGKSWEEHQDSLGYSYYKITLKKSNEDDLTIAAASTMDMGETKVSELATRLITELKPSCLAMTGVCAGNKEDVFLGDVIVADRVFQFDYGKLIAYYQEVKGHKFRTEEISYDITTYNLKPLWKHKVQNFSQGWIEKIQTIRPKSYQHQEHWLLNKLYDYQENSESNLTPQKHPERVTECPDWRQVIERLRKQELLKTDSFELTEQGTEEVENERLLCLDDERYRDPSIPQVHIGVIGTTSYVQKDPEIFERLKRVQRKAIGIEMEGAAVGAVAEIHDIPMIVFKSVQDYADYDKSDQFRLYAA